MSKPHPLINQKASHYDANGEPYIKQLEREISCAEMAGYCYGNIGKYKYRAEHKGQKESDLEKIADYERYFDVIKNLLHRGHKKLTVSHALEIEGIKYD